jgi:cytoskeletal protein RodZ
MTSIGETLRRERIRRNLELDRISKDLKISVKLLDAMEADRFDKLPSGVFTRSFVRQYARYLELDDQEIAASLQRMLEPPPVPADIPEPKPPVAINIPLPRVKNWMAVGDSEAAWFSSLRALALVVVVVLVCSAVYSWSQRPRRRPAVDLSETPKPSQPVPAAPGKIEQKPAMPPVAPARIDDPDAVSAERLAAPTVRVQLTAAEPVWILAKTDGKYAFSGTIEANSSRVVEGSDRVFLKLGNAGGVLVWLNGRAMGMLGDEGQVLQVQFTSGGFQIVPADAGTPGDDGPSEPGDTPAPL